jgi:hypothetical protein
VVRKRKTANWLPKNILREGGARSPEIRLSVIPGTINIDEVMNSASIGQHKNLREVEVE